MSAPDHEPNVRGRARIRFPEQLPITARVADVIDALSRHQVVIVAGATGSGKTTQLPKIALEMGRGGKRQIGVTEPRRLAATSVAARVARELECELGQEVGYQIRFEDRTSQNTWVKFMTDGILLAELQGDRNLDAYDTLIIDEAHERSLNIDFLIGSLKLVLPQRPDLKLIVSSATIETARFSEFFGGAPVIQVEGRTYPVEVLYEPPDSALDLSEAVAQAIVNVTSLDPRGDILVFFPGEREIREAEHQLSKLSLRHTKVQPLYSRLSTADQAKVFTPITERRIILSTNVAETSLTIPGITYVIDTGQVRLSRYDSRTGTTRLQVEGISQASADQRKGRCGRVSEGLCIRLYDSENFTQRPAYTDPEILRTGLSGVILRMKALGLGDIEVFPFLDAPKSKYVTEGYRVLIELGALTEARELTPLGRQLAQFPVDPRVARMIVAGAQLGCVDEVLVVAAALNTLDPRERPRGQEAKADSLHQRFKDENSDFLGLLRLWNFLNDPRLKGSSSLRRACKESFLSFTRVREWFELHKQLEGLVKEQHLVRNAAPKKHSTHSQPPSPCANPDAFHQALLSGLLSRIGLYHSEHKSYIGARQTRFTLHPASGLAKRPPAWIMAFELVETTQLQARLAARIEPAWLEQVGAHLLRRSYSDPHWSEKSARASVREHVSLFGLPVLKDRSVDYSLVSREHARKLFIEHALVRGEYLCDGKFLDHNRQKFDQVARLRDKARQSDLLIDDAELYTFFDAKIPETVVNGKTFEAWRKEAEAKSPRLLFLSESVILGNSPQIRAKDYPDQITTSDVALQASYVFDPAAQDDGITLQIPWLMLTQLDPSQLEYIIEPWRPRKIEELLEALPRKYRRALGDLRELARSVAPRHLPQSGPYLESLSRVILDVTGVEVAIDDYRLEAIPPYLRFHFRLLGDDDRVLASTRDLADLQKQFRPQVSARLHQNGKPAAWSRTGIVRWDLQDLPDYVTWTVQGTRLRSFPCLIDRGTSVELTLMDTEALAAKSHLTGIRRLLTLALAGQLSPFAKRLPAPLTQRRGLPARRTDVDAFHAQVIARVIDDCFALSSLANIPRSKAEYQSLLELGTPRLKSTFDTALRALAQIAAEHEKLLVSLERTATQPSGSAAAADVRTQLEYLVTGELVACTEVSRLVHVPRYLLAAQARLLRAVQDPRKDAAKAAPLSPLWKAFLQKRKTATDSDAAAKIHWALEELRVSIFAPELRPAETVNVLALARAIEGLR